MGEIQLAAVTPTLGASTGNLNVACVAVNVNNATIVGIPRQDDPDQPFRGGAVIGVTDNGEGGSAVPDTMSFLHASVPFGTSARDVCDFVGTPGGLRPVMKGNIQVHS